MTTTRRPVRRTQAGFALSADVPSAACARRPTTRPRRGRRGFTLVEILAVLAILSLLMSLAVYSFSRYTERGREAATKSTITALQGLITSYETKRGGPPPDSLAKFKPAIRSDNDVNEGAEALCAALHHKDYPEGASLDEKSLGNTDEDSTQSAYHRNGSTFLLEAVDGWGNPIAYLTPPSYGKEFTYRMAEPDNPDDPDQVVTAKKSEKTGVWANADSYQLISAGPDKRFGTDDDITNFQ